MVSDAISACDQHWNLHDIVLPVSRRTINRWFNTEAGFSRNSAQLWGANIRTMLTRHSVVRAEYIASQHGLRNSDWRVADQQSDAICA